MKYKAKETDLIVVLGDLGTAYLGLQVLQRVTFKYKINT